MFIFKGSTTGTITDENGRFYLESDERYSAIEVSFVGFETKEIILDRAVTYKLDIVLKEGNELDEVVIYTGKQSKKKQSCNRYT